MLRWSSKLDLPTEQAFGEVKPQPPGLLGARVDGSVGTYSMSSFEVRSAIGSRSPRADRLRFLIESGGGDRTTADGYAGRVVDQQQEQRVLSLVLDGLDDLYDQRFGGPVDQIRDTRAEVWLQRLLITSSLALRGTPWEHRLSGVADEIGSLFRSGLRGHDLNDRVLQATDSLRSEAAASF